MGAFLLRKIVTVSDRLVGVHNHWVCEASRIPGVKCGKPTRERESRRVCVVHDHGVRGWPDNFCGVVRGWGELQQKK